MVKAQTLSRRKTAHMFPDKAALTSAEIHAPPQVVQVRLPDLHVVCRLNETRIQGLLENICRKSRAKQSVATILPEGPRFQTRWTV